MSQLESPYVTYVDLIVKGYCAADIITGSIFWIWAMYNVIHLKDNSPSVHNGIDFGILSMIFLIFCGIYGLTSIYSFDKSVRIKFAKAHYRMAIISHLLVILNFAAGLWLAPNHNYGYFCFTFIVIFILSGILQYKFGRMWYLILQNPNIHIHSNKNDVSLNDQSSKYHM